MCAFNSVALGYTKNHPTMKGGDFRYMARNARLYTLSHSTYVCQYHVVWVTKYRGTTMADRYIKRELRTIFKAIAKWKGFTILQWHIGDEHIHLYVIIPPKYSVSYAIQVFKGKSSSWIKKKTKSRTTSRIKTNTVLNSPNSRFGAGEPCKTKTTSITGGFYF